MLFLYSCLHTDAYIPHPVRVWNVAMITRSRAGFREILVWEKRMNRISRVFISIYIPTSAQS